MNVLHKHKTTALDEFQSDILFTQLILSCTYVAVYVASLISVQSEYLQEGLQPYLCI